MVFGFGKKVEKVDQSTKIYMLLKTKIDDLVVHTSVLTNEVESSTFAKKLEEYNNEFLEFLNNLQTFENFFIQSKQVNKINVLQQFLTSRPKVQFLFKLEKENKNKENLEKRIVELKTLKQKIQDANKSDLKA